MPELPEVETVVRQLKKNIPFGSELNQIQISRFKLRFNLNSQQRSLIQKNKLGALKNIFRRAKFIVFEFENYILISHLGMTGVWRKAAPKSGLRASLPKKSTYFLTEKHDHVFLNFSLNQNNYGLIYNDPRRFGFLHLLEPEQWADKQLSLGFEPLELDDQSFDRLFFQMKKSQVDLKTFIMDQKRLVGVGNIYASEALFRSGLSPFKMSDQITKKDCLTLTQEIKKILTLAIENGGSTIENYKNFESETGQFQNFHQVYGREDQQCVRCATGIVQRENQKGRSTFYCNACQK